MDEIERIIRPIVEGQIRGFTKEHPSIVEAVDWYKVPGRDKATTFINSLSKRIVLDLTCDMTIARLEEAFWHAHMERRLKTVSWQVTDCDQWKTIWNFSLDRFFRLFHL